MQYNEERTGHSGIREEWVVTEVTAQRGKELRQHEIRELRGLHNVSEQLELFSI